MAHPLVNDRGGDVNEHEEVWIIAVADQGPEVERVGNLIQVSGKAVNEHCPPAEAINFALDQGQDRFSREERFRVAALDDIERLCNGDETAVVPLQEGDEFLALDGIVEVGMHAADDIANREMRHPLASHGFHEQLGVGSLAGVLLAEEKPHERIFAKIIAEFLDRRSGFQLKVAAAFHRILEAEVGRPLNLGFKNGEV